MSMMTDAITIIAKYVAWCEKQGIEQGYIGSLVTRLSDDGGHADRDGQDGNKSLKNCVNCIHNEVCMTVHNRRVSRANDYSPCEYWEAKP